VATADDHDTPSRQAPDPHTIASKGHLALSGGTDACKDSSVITTKRASLRSKTTAIRAQWEELTRSRWLIVAVLATTVGASGLLGFVIPRSVERYIINERVEALRRTVEHLAEQVAIPTSSSTTAEFEAFDQVVDLELIGGDTRRVKLWGPGGELLYSDISELQRKTFAQPAHVTEAFAGSVVVDYPDLSLPQNQYEAGLGPLIEVYIPIVGQDGQGISTVFEVYQDAQPLADAVSSVRRFAWLSIGLTLSALALFFLALALGRARVLNRRTRDAEERADDLERVREQERKRIVGALHDDIGQPLYRVLYGIQGCRSQMTGGAVAHELSSLEGLIRSIDATLKTELRLLHADSMSPLVGDELDTLLGELVDQFNHGSPLEVELDADQHDALAPTTSIALFRAAREALTNAQKHSGARNVRVRLFEGNGRIILDVEDDGRGPQTEPGLGLITTQERLEAIGGGITLSRRTGGGALFRAWAPMWEQT